MNPERTQPCISIQDLEKAITEIYLDFIDLEKEVSLEFALGQLKALQDLADGVGAKTAVEAAEETARICRTLDGEKWALLHGEML